MTAESFLNSGLFSLKYDNFAHGGFKNQKKRRFDQMMDYG